MKHINLLVLAASIFSLNAGVIETSEILNDNLDIKKHSLNTSNDIKFKNLKLENNTINYELEYDDSSFKLVDIDLMNFNSDSVLETVKEVKSFTNLEPGTTYYINANYTKLNSDDETIYTSKSESLFNDNIEDEWKYYTVNPFFNCAYLNGSKNRYKGFTYQPTIYSLYKDKDLVDQQSVGQGNSIRLGNLEENTNYTVKVDFNAERIGGKEKDLLITQTYDFKTLSSDDFGLTCELSEIRNNSASVLFTSLNDSLNSNNVKIKEYKNGAFVEETNFNYLETYYTLKDFDNRASYKLVVERNFALGRKDKYTITNEFQFNIDLCTIDYSNNLMLSCSSFKNSLVISFSDNSELYNDQKTELIIDKCELKLGIQTISPTSSDGNTFTFNNLEAYHAYNCYVEATFKNRSYKQKVIKTFAVHTDSDYSQKPDLDFAYRYLPEDKLIFDITVRGAHYYETTITKATVYDYQGKKVKDVDPKDLTVTGLDNSLNYYLEVEYSYYDWNNPHKIYKTKQFDFVYRFEYEEFMYLDVDVDLDNKVNPRIEFRNHTSSTYTNVKDVSCKFYENGLLVNPKIEDERYIGFKENTKYECVAEVHCNDVRTEAEYFITLKANFKTHAAFKEQISCTLTPKTNSIAYKINTTEGKNYTVEVDKINVYMSQDHIYATHKEALSGEITDLISNREYSFYIYLNIIDNEGTLYHINYILYQIL